MRKFLKWIFNMKDSDFASADSVFTDDISGAVPPLGDGGTTVINPEVEKAVFGKAKPTTNVVTLAPKSVKPKTASKKLGVKSKAKNKAQASARA